MDFELEREQQTRYEDFVKVSILMGEWSYHFLKEGNGVSELFQRYAESLAGAESSVEGLITFAENEGAASSELLKRGLWLIFKDRYVSEQLHRLPVELRVMQRDNGGRTEGDVTEREGYVKFPWELIAEKYTRK